MAGLYIHIPFCKTRCHYCDFFSTTRLEERTKFFDALTRELECERDFIKDKSLATIYIGGGTPSLALPVEIEALYGTIGRLWNIEDIAESTMEVNPNDLTAKYLHEISQLPITRLSIGIQSFDDEILRFLNRRHTSMQAVEAISLAREAGFDNISLDLIYGIPGMTMTQWSDTVDMAVSMGVQHISAYHLTIEPRTVFGLRLRKGELKQADDTEGEMQFEILRRKLTDAGYDHYEISNFALPLRAAIHNSSYWSGQPYLGVGPSAHSYDGRKLRRWCAQSLDEYMQSPVYQTEILTNDELYNEYVMTSLRTSAGVEPAKLKEYLGERYLHHFILSAEPFLCSGAMSVKDGRYIIPGEKFLISDYVIASLFV